MNRHSASPTGITINDTQLNVVPHHMINANTFFYGPAISVIEIDKHVRRLISNPFTVAVINAIEINRYKGVLNRETKNRKALHKLTQSDKE